MGFQNLICCPDCDEKVSIFAEICPHCGRPIKKYIEEHKINDFTKGFMCPKCGEKEAMYFTSYRRVNCEYCRTPYIQTKYEIVDFFNHYDESKENILHDLKELGLEDQFDENLYNKRHMKEEEFRKRNREEARQRLLQQASQPSAAPASTNQPHCPACQSTNIEKIGIFKRMLSTNMFGIASKKIGKQFHCKNCGYDF